MISFIISSCGRHHLLQTCVDSIQRQVTDGIQTEIVILNSLRGQIRTDGLKLAKGSVLFFLDEDCELPDPQFLARALDFLSNHSTKSIVGGYYLNSPTSTYSVRAYNSLCNQWINITRNEDATENLLGGAFLAHRESLDLIVDPPPLTWGGEDTYLFRKLQEQGISTLISSDFSVIHNDESSVQKWICRAFLHGYNRNKYHLGSKKFLLNFSIFKDALTFLPYYFLHFSILGLGVFTHFMVAQTLQIKGLFFANQHESKKV